MEKVTCAWSSGGRGGRSRSKGGVQLCGCRRDVLSLLRGLRAVVAGLTHQGAALVFNSWSEARQSLCEIERSLDRLEVSEGRIWVLPCTGTASPVAPPRQVGSAVAVGAEEPLTLLPSTHCAHLIAQSYPLRVGQNETGLAWERSQGVARCCVLRADGVMVRDDGERSPQ